MTVVGKVPGELRKKFMPYLTFDSPENVHLLSISLLCSETSSQVAAVQERAEVGG